MLIVVSVGAVSAADDVAEVAADSDVAEVATADADADVDVELSAADEPVLTQTRTVSGNTSADVQASIDEAQDGDVIDLGSDKTYEFTQTVNVNKNVTISGNNVIINCNATENLKNGYMYVTKPGSGTIISGLTLNNVGPYLNLHYTGEDTIQGWGIYIKGATNCIVDNCIFWDWNHAVRIQGQANYNTVQNSQFYGGTATFINNLPNGEKDRGTYYVGIMGSTGCVVTNNWFVGPACDAVSIASGSGGNNVTNNYMEGCAYGIYFGGDSTKNTYLLNNTFVKVGSFESDVYNATTDEVIGHVRFVDLPVISVQKSADGFTVADNKFYATTGNILIAAQEGNTAHGYPSDMGNFQIVNNEIYPFDENVVMETVVLCQIESNIGTLTPTGALNITNNKLNGAKTATYWSNEWGYNKGDVYIEAAPKVITIITIESLDFTQITANLKDLNGKVLAGEAIYYTINGVNGSTETDMDGVFIIPKPNGLINITYNGTNTLAPANVVISTNFNLINLTTITDDSISKDKLVASLIDAYGDPIANQNITFVMGDLTNTTTTDEYGVFTIDAPNGFIGMSYSGNENYSGTENVVEVTMPTQKATKIIADSLVTRTAVDYNAGERGTKYYFYLQDEDGKPLANKAIKIGVVGKIYTAKTDANGRAGIDISIANANSYTYALTFLGDDEYKAAFAVSELKIVKKPVTITPAKTSYTFKASAKTKTITATLKSNNAYIPKGKQVTLAIAGKTFKATIGDKGQISFNIGSITAKGTYKVAIKYAGSNTYNAATSTTITVKIS